MLIVNGGALPEPDRINPSIMDLDGSAERNMLGLLLRDRIATKRKLAVEYGVLTAEETKTVLTAIAGEFFNVTYMDPLHGEYTITCYVGDRSAEYVDKNHWKLKFDLIER